MTISEYVRYYKKTLEQDIFFLSEIFRLGRYYGYPACCILYFAEISIKNKQIDKWHTGKGRILCAIHKNQANSISTKNKNFNFEIIPDYIRTVNKNGKPYFRKDNNFI
jgi:hypothetical protein